MIIEYNLVVTAEKTLCPKKLLDFLCNIIPILINYLFKFIQIFIAYFLEGEAGMGKFYHQFTISSRN